MLEQGIIKNSISPEMYEKKLYFEAYYLDLLVIFLTLLSLFYSYIHGQFEALPFSQDIDDIERSPKSRALTSAGNVLSSSLVAVMLLVVS